VFQSQGGFLRRRDDLADDSSRRRSTSFNPRAGFTASRGRVCRPRLLARVSIPGRVSTASRPRDTGDSMFARPRFNPRAGFYGVATDEGQLPLGRRGTATCFNPRAGFYGVATRPIEASFNPRAGYYGVSIPGRVSTASRPIGSNRRDRSTASVFQSQGGFLRRRDATRSDSRRPRRSEVFQSQGGFLRRRDRTRSRRRDEGDHALFQSQGGFLRRRDRDVRIAAPFRTCFNPRAGFYGVATSVATLAGRARFQSQGGFLRRRDVRNSPRRVSGVSIPGRVSTASRPSPRRRSQGRRRVSIPGRVSTASRPVEPRRLTVSVMFQSQGGFLRRRDVPEIPGRFRRRRDPRAGFYGVPGGFLRRRDDASLGRIRVSIPGRVSTASRPPRRARRPTTETIRFNPRAGFYGVATRDCDR